MKQRGKTVKTEQDKSKHLYDLNYFSSSSSSLCKKHPSNPSPVGVCAYCLNEKLINLVCSDCGEQRLSSCSCSDISSYRNSSCNLDVGSVGRVSFLIENDKCCNFGEQKTLFSHMMKKQSEPENIAMLKRSNSCAIGLKKNHGFWKIGKIFKKKRDNDGFSVKSSGGFDQKSEDFVMDVSRSRSLSSFTDGPFESAKVSNFTEFEPRKSEFTGGLKKFNQRNSFKETDSGVLEDDEDDDDEFIDLKIDLHKSRTEHSVFKKYDALELSSNGEIGSSSCRFTVNDRGIKKVKNGHRKPWNCIFNQHSRKKDHNHILES